MDIKNCLVRNESCIYCLRFPNGMRYIGKTSHLGNRMRLYLRSVESGDGGKVCDAIREFGVDSVVVDIIAVVSGLGVDDTELCLSILEIKYIREMDTLFPRGYNVSLGGEALRIPPEYIITDKEEIRAFKNGSKSLLVYDIEGKLIEEYDSIARFAYDKGFDEEAVRVVVNKARAYLGRYILRTKKYGYAPRMIDTSGIKVVERKKYKTVVEERTIIREKRSTRVGAIVYDLNGDFVGEYKTKAEAERMLTGGSLIWGKYIRGYIAFKKTSDDYPKKIESYLEFKGRVLSEEYRSASELCTLPPPKHTLKNDRPVNQFTLDGEFVAQYPTLRGAAACQSDISYSQIYACIKGKTRRAGSYIWRWASDCGDNNDASIANM